MSSRTEAVKSPAIEAKKLWRGHERQQDTAAGKPDLHIGIAASFTANTLVPFVGAHLISNGLRPSFDIGPYNQLFQVCYAPAAHFSAPCDVLVLLWCIEDLMSEELLAVLHGERPVDHVVAEKTAALASAIRQLRGNFGGMLVVGVPPLPDAVTSHSLLLEHSRGLGTLHRLVAGKFVDQLRAIDGVNLIDLDAIQRSVGTARSFDPRQWYLYRQPFSDEFLHGCGTALGRIVVAAKRPARKCIVLDCDNTLWGGIIGEDGLDGIQVGDEFPGSAYRDFHKLLLAWRQQGVLLALASKNNEDDVWEVFDKHRGMALRREHVSAWQINWRPKAENIPLIAEALNIGTDSLVFIDDNPMEIDYMRGARPEVASVLLPEDPADIISAMRGLTLFDRLEITQEDRGRADMMRAEHDRKALSGQMDHADFLKALQLRLDLFEAGVEDLGRITQLINKTNQFNLTTVRRTLDEVRQLAASTGHRVFGLRVADRFGDYGLTGAVIADISPDGRTWTIDTLLLSCRVLGRGVEAGLVAALAQDARTLGATAFAASFIPTKKNALAASFLSDHGFRETGDGRWLLRLTDAPPLPAHVVREPDAHRATADAGAPGAATDHGKPKRANVALHVTE